MTADALPEQVAVLPGAVEPLVSVVIPARNAEQTIATTLDSALAQTHSRLEVVVVDDGSSDRTAEIVRAYADRDARLRLLSIPNAGVAAARNAGAGLAHGAFLGFLDADDLWHPMTVAKQIAALEAGGPGTGFSYALFRLIDGEDRVTGDGAPLICEGRVFIDLMTTNFVGNGSGLMMRREAFEEVGGYDTSLHAVGAEGCEDFLLQSLVALRWRVAAVPEYLIGYRRLPWAMSTDQARMLRSRLLAFEKIEAVTRGVSPALFRRAAAAQIVPVAVWLCRRGRLLEAARAAASALRRAPGVALAVLAHELAAPFRGRVEKLARGLRGARDRGDGKPFGEVDPRQGAARRMVHYLSPWFARFPDPAPDAEPGSLRSLAA